jgi:hypothetical protein
MIPVHWLQILTDVGIGVLTGFCTGVIVTYRKAHRRGVQVGIGLVLNDLGCRMASGQLMFRPPSPPPVPGARCPVCKQPYNREGLCATLGCYLAKQSTLN